MPTNSVLRAISGGVAIFALATGAAWGDPVIIATPITSTGGLAGFDIDVDPNGVIYDTIEVTISGSNFSQTGNANPVFAGSDDTGFLLDMTLGGFNVVLPTVTSSSLEGNWASLGDDSISAATVNIAQVVFQSGATPAFSYVFNFADDGNRLATLIGDVPTVVPEISSSIYMAASTLLFGLGMIRARWRRHGAATPS